MLQPTILHVNDPAGGRAPTAISIADATRFVKQGQQRQQLLAEQQQQLNLPNAKTTNTNLKPTNNGSINSSKANAKKSNEYVTSQENSGPINGNSRLQTNQRNRLHPLSTAKSPFGPIVNRSSIQSATTNGAPITTLPPTTTNAPATTSRIDRGNGQSRDQNQGNTPNNIRVNKLLRQPLFAGRETPQQPIKRINVTHNGSANRDTSQEVSNRTHQLQLLQQARQKLRGSSGESGGRVPSAQEPTLPIKTSQGTQIASDTADEVVDEGEEVFYDDDEVAEKDDGQPDTALPKSSEENKPVILTSNFFLPGKPLPKFEKHDVNQQPNDLSNDGEVNEETKDMADDVIDDGASIPTNDNHASKPTENETNHEKHSTHTVDLKSTKPVVEDPNVEYEYEYEEYVDEPTTHSLSSTVAVKPTTGQNRHANNGEAQREHFEHDDSKDTINDESNPESYATEKPIADESTKSSHDAQIETSVDPVETSSVSTSTTKENVVESTESYVVVASVQTSRSISGARFLTFPQVEQDEKKQTLSDLDKEAKTDKDDESVVDNDEYKSDDLLSGHNDTDGNEEIESVTEISTEVGETNSEVSKATTGDVVKSKVHKLSSVSEKLAHLHELNEPKPELTTKSIPVVIRKFLPRTTIPPTRKPSATSRATSTTRTTTEPIPLPIKPIEDFSEELASLLPPGFKYRGSQAKSSAPKTEMTKSVATKSVSTDEAHKNGQNKSFGGIRFEEIALDKLLPKGYKPPEDKPKVENESKSIDLSLILSKIKFDENIDTLLPKDYKTAMQAATPSTSPPFRLSTANEDVSKFLPPGFKLPKESTTKRSMLKTTLDDVSKFLPPGYKLPRTTAATTTTTTEPSVDIESTEIQSSEELLNKIKFDSNLGSLIPPGFKNNDNDKEPMSGGDAGGSSPNFKVVFPKSLHKRPAVRMSTSKPTLNEGPVIPGITIRKGLPVR